MLSRSISYIRTVGGRAALVASALFVLLLTLTGCGQRTSSTPETANSAGTDTVARVLPALTDSSAQLPVPEQLVSTTASSEPSEPPEPANLSAQRSALKQSVRASTPSDSARRTGANAEPGQKVTGVVALERAAATGKYLLMLFYRADDDQTREMRSVLADAGEKQGAKVNTLDVDVTDEKEREIVARYGVDRAPMPLALVVAPNGAVTGGFPGSVSEEQLAGAFAGPATADCLKALQDGKFVLVCVQNASTKLNDAALRGAREFKADTLYQKTTELISLDPSEAADVKFLRQLRIDPATDVAVTAFLAPPGSVIATYTGATDKNTLVAALTAATAGGGG